MLRTIGIFGFTNLTLLAFFVLSRWISRLQYSKNDLKKNATHLLLLFSCLCDLPMYIGFMIDDDYSLETYSFHKLVSALLFGAYSITILDWSNVLQNIYEDEFKIFIFNHYTLILTNVLFVTISLMNFIYCFTVTSMTNYTDSVAYFLCEIIQVAGPLILSSIMLYSGVKLANRIQRATGSHNEVRDPELVKAVRRLMLVMTICVFFVLLQVLLAMLNIFLGYARQRDKTVGPKLFFWMFYEWIPLWAITCALLYLNRTSTKQNIEANSKPSSRWGLKQSLLEADNSGNTYSSHNSSGPGVGMEHLDQIDPHTALIDDSEGDLNNVILIRHHYQGDRESELFESGSSDPNSSRSTSHDVFNRKPVDRESSFYGLYENSDIFNFNSQRSFSHITPNSRQNSINPYQSSALPAPSNLTIVVSPLTLPSTLSPTKQSIQNSYLHSSSVETDAELEAASDRVGLITSVSKDSSQSSAASEHSHDFIESLLLSSSSPAASSSSSPDKFAKYT